MARFLIDVNLPYRFSLWAGDDFVHAKDLGERWSDSELWAYARSHDLVIVSKDSNSSASSMARREWAVDWAFGTGAVVG